MTTVPVSGTSRALGARHRSAGFTLIEVMIVLTILLGVFGAVLISFLVGRRSHVAGDAYVQVQQEARRAVDEMIKELRGSTTDRLFLVGTDTVVFQVPNDNDDDGSVTTGGALEWGAPGVADGCIQYAFTGGQIQRTLLAGPFDSEAQTCGDAAAGEPVWTVGNHVEDVTFTATTGGMRISVTTQMTEQLAGDGQSATITGRAQYRNL
ncbi:MAG: type II secretion system protein [Candidatus Omnitrophica bacterium]|nr:type II secretion system protein [Candidatus Omnitrophota bacterium]